MFGLSIDLSEVTILEENFETSKFALDSIGYFDYEYPQDGIKVPESPKFLIWETPGRRLIDKIK